MLKEATEAERGEVASGENGASNSPQESDHHRERRQSLMDETLKMGHRDLYEVLGLVRGNEPTEDDIKRAYRKLALKHHPDKNPDDPHAAETFKEINFANSVLSNPTKKQVYDAYGNMGLQMMDTIGEENFATYMLLQSKWMKCCVITCFLFTGCCCCLCCCCCCDCCCGKFKPKPPPGYEDEFYQFQQQHDDRDPIINQQPTSSNTSGPVPPVVTSQPSSSNNSKHKVRGHHSPPPDRPTIIAMPPPTHNDDADNGNAQPVAHHLDEHTKLNEFNSSSSDSNKDYGTVSVEKDP